MDDTSINALALWTGLNLLLMLILAVNVSRLRIKGLKADVDPEVLNRAVRAHGNNIEYVPSALLAMGLLTWLGYSSTWVHALGGTLFTARLLHAYGIQQIVTGGPPPARVLGNIATWSVFLVVSVLLIYRSAAA